jgi:DNA (cytosine-5)-methyltransferase 1
VRYLSVCSGIEAATIAWEPLGWRAVGFAEIDKFASAVLAERFGSNLLGEPLSRNGVPNFGDFTSIDVTALGPVDLLVGGTPCQAFSFAGRRLSLADARGNLTLAYAVLAHELARSNGLRNALWENVPGVLSTDDNAFGCFLGALVGADDAVPLPSGIERWPDAGMVSGPRARAAWRVLDAQYFGLAQRRERVFVVVDFGNGADPAAILFEPQGVQGNSPPRREAGERVAGTVAARTQGGGGLGTDFDCDGGLVPEGVAYGGGIPRQRRRDARYRLSAALRAQ